MFPKPVADLAPNTLAFEITPLVKPTGFREYDARWWFGHPSSPKAPEINLMGIQALGMGLGTLLTELGVKREIVTGHDFRGYSSSIKNSLITGLLASGCRVHDIGLAMSPMAYFAQFELDVPAVAMVTASHNDNGWTGVKMGSQRPVTFGPDEMGRLRDIVLSGKFDLTGGGSYNFVSDFAARYIADLTRRPKYTRRIRAVAACGNGTAGAFAPGILEALGVDVIPLDTKLDHTFPRYNPNPEDMKMLHAMADAIREHKADVALGFDGDGDRCGVVDNEGNEIFADKIGVMLARDLSTVYGPSTFVVDVKSTGLFHSDPELKRLGAKVDYWKTGHSYIKRRVADLGALAGFEKSGHFFFNAPVGRGYCGPRHAGAEPDEVDGGSVPRHPQDVGIAHNGAALRRRDQVRHRGESGQDFRGQVCCGRKSRRPVDFDTCDGQWRSRHGRGWQLGLDPGIFQQARACRRG
jgi:phosphomannomutase / phosphoglucomutase